MTLSQTPPIIAQQSSSTVAPVQSPSSTNYLPPPQQTTSQQPNARTNWAELLQSVGGAGAILILVGTVISVGYYLLCEIHNSEIEIAKLTEKLESASGDIADVKKKHEEFQQKFQDVNVNLAILKERSDTKLSKSH